MFTSVFDDEMIVVMVVPKRLSLQLKKFKFSPSKEVWRGPKYSAVFVEIKFGIGKKKWLIDINFFNLVLKIRAECEEIVLYLRDLTV